MKVIANVVLALVATTAMPVQGFVHMQVQPTITTKSFMNGFRPRSNSYLDTLNNKSIMSSSRNARGTTTELSNYSERNGNSNGRYERDNGRMPDRFDSSMNSPRFRNERNLERSAYGSGSRYPGNEREEWYRQENNNGPRLAGLSGITSKYERYNPNRHTKSGEPNMMMEEDFGNYPGSGYYNDLPRGRSDIQYNIPRDGLYNNQNNNNDRFYYDRMNNARRDEFVDRSSGGTLQRYDRNLHRTNGQNRMENLDRFYGSNPLDRMQDGRRLESENYVWGENRNSNRRGPGEGGFIMSDNEIRERNAQMKTENPFGWQNQEIKGNRRMPGRAGGLAGSDVFADNWWEGSQSANGRRTTNTDSYDRNVNAGQRTVLQRYNGGMMDGQQHQQNGPMRRFEDPYRPGDRNLMGEDYSFGPRYLSGGKLERFSVDPSIASVMVELWSEGLPIQATIEVLEGGQRRQSFPVYVEDGYTNPYSTRIELPGMSGGTILIRNDGPIEYPITANVQPQSRRDVGPGDSNSDNNSRGYPPGAQRGGTNNMNTRSWSPENTGW